jgi:hypothetical protein
MAITPSAMHPAGVGGDHAGIIQQPDAEPGGDQDEHAPQNPKSHGKSHPIK